MLFLWILRDCSCFLILVARSMRKGRVLTESKILEKIFKFAQQSSRPGKSLENWAKVLKNGKKFEFFLSCSGCKWIFFSFCLNLIQSRPYVCSASSKNLWVCFLSFFKVSFDHLFDNSVSGKRNHCFWKKSWRNLEFWIQKYVRTLGVKLSLNEQYPDQNTIPNQQNIHCYTFAHLSGLLLWLRNVLNYYDDGSN